MIRRRLGGLLFVLGALVSFVGCGSSSGGAVTITSSDAYTAAIRWYLNDVEPSTVATGDTKALVVYVVSNGGKAIDSRTQAAVVADLADIKDQVTVRFADVLDEALDQKTDGLPVKDEGVLLLVGTVVEGPPPVQLDVEVYHDASDEQMLSMTVTKTDDVVQATVSTAAGQG